MKSIEPDQRRRTSRDLQQLGDDFDGLGGLVTQEWTQQNREPTTSYEPANANGGYLTIY